MKNWTFSCLSLCLVILLSVFQTVFLTGCTQTPVKDTNSDIAQPTKSLRDFLPQLNALGWVEDSKPCLKKATQEALCLKKSVDANNFFKKVNKKYSASIVRIEALSPKVNILVHEMNSDSHRSVDKLSDELQSVFE